MKHRNYKPYLFVIALILLAMSLPPTSSEVLRSGAVAIVKPFWQPLLFASVPMGGGEESENEDMAKLRHENELLKGEVAKLEELFHHELLLLSQLAAGLKAGGSDELIEKHRQEVASHLSLKLQSLPAQVIFRSPASWSSSLWINVGEADNKTSEAIVVAKNSPVIVGSSVVGVVDYVGKRQSRVRLITDAGLTPSVRAARGDASNRRLLVSVQQLLASLAASNDIFANGKEKKQWLARLDTLKKMIADGSDNSWLIAKGEIHGSSEPLWRSRGDRLVGIGFNYDFADDEGPARDLRSGRPINGPDGMEPLPLITANDLLVTTGFDGVFPPGLHVGTVTKVAPLKEGDYTYSIEAVPTAGNLGDLTLVFVLPPSDYDSSDRPPVIGR